MHKLSWYWFGLMMLLLVDDVTTCRWCYYLSMMLLHADDVTTRWWCYHALMMVLSSVYLESAPGVILTAKLTIPSWFLLTLMIRVRLVYSIWNLPLMGVWTLKWASSDWSWLGLIMLRRLAHLESALSVVQTSGGTTSDRSWLCRMMLLRLANCILHLVTIPTL